MSHSMPMISSFCNRCILLNSGKIQAEGEKGDVIANYLMSDRGISAFVDYTPSSLPPGDNLAALLSGWIETSLGENVFEIKITEPLRIFMGYHILKDVPKIPYPNFHVLHVYISQRQCVFISSPIMDYNQPCVTGEYFVVCEIPRNFLNEGIFSVHLALTFTHSGIHVSFYGKHVFTFSITDPIDGTPTRPTGYSDRILGVVQPLL